ncbi:L-rhamnose mutarotase [Leifsonia sp. Root227]|uniref:L-rhamnose mutarotase n=1 Tax=Leifsonia sp. Root227 TaxID=1736496 RepID=UPI000B20A46F|nr:L-rhamnose mutarotase [Leifsonia sp. Root227]
MAQEDGVGAEKLEFRTRLKPGMAEAYQEFHRAIHTELADVMREAGVLAWQIYRNGDVLTHRVETLQPSRLARELDPHPVNVSWQRQVAPYLAVGAEPAAVQYAGALIWDFAWPTR